MLRYFIILFLITLVAGCDNGGAFFKNETPDDVKELVDIQILPAIELSQSLNSREELTIAEGGELYFRAIGVYSDRTTDDITELSEWTSTNEESLLLQSNGKGIGVSPGHSGVIASLGDVFSSTINVTVVGEEIESIKVTPEILDIGLGERSRMRAIATYTDKSTADVSESVSWEIDDTGIVGLVDGLVEGRTVGTTHIRATYNGIESNNSTINVWNRSLERVLLEPNFIELPIGASYQFSVFALYRDNDTGEYFTSDVTDQVFWIDESEDNSLIRLTNEGVVVALSRGHAQIRAQYLEQLSDSGSIHIFDEELLALEIKPKSGDLSINEFINFTAIGLFSDSRRYDMSYSVDWRGNDASVLAVVPPGLGYAVGAGTTSLYAQYEAIKSGKAEVSVSDRQLVDLSIFPTDFALAKGSEKRLEAYAHYSDGKVRNISSRASWEMLSEPTIATLEENLVTAKEVGVAEFAVNFGGFEARTHVEVLDATVENISISPAVFTLANGRSKQLEVFAHYSNGAMLDVTNTAKWNSSDFFVADSIGGNVVAKNVGSVSITADYAGYSAVSDVTISDAVMTGFNIEPKVLKLPKGDTLLLQTYALYSDGSKLEVTASSQWESSDHFKASVVEGNVTAREETGTVVITATYDEFYDSSSVVLTDAQISKISIEPKSVLLGEGDVYQLEAIAHYSDRTVQTITPSVQWTTSDVLLAQVVKGLVTGKGTSGEAYIGAVYGKYRDEARIKLTDATVIDVVVDPDSIFLGNGETEQLQAIALYSDGSSQQVTGTAIWATDEPLIAGVQQGRVTGYGTSGTATISAAYGGHEGSAIVTLTDRVVSRISVEPEEFVLGDGDKRQLRAYAHYSDGGFREINGIASWESEAPELASVRGGLVAGHASSGSSIISVKYLDYTASSRVSLTDASVDDVFVVPESFTIGKGDVRQLKLFARYSDGHIREVTADNWRSTDDTLVSIEDGLVTGLSSSGLVTVSANYGNHVARSEVTLTSAVVMDVMIDPSSLTLRAGDKQRLRLWAIYSDGSNREVYSNSWFSSDVTQASVTDGLVTTYGSSGEVSITAHYRGHSATSVVNLTGATLEDLWIDPDSFVLGNGEERKLSAYALYSDGTYQKVNADSWKSSDSTLVDVFDGRVQSKGSVGSAIITAEYSGYSATSEVSLTTAIVVDIDVLPKQFVLGKNNEKQLEAWAHYSDGSTQNITATATWVSSEPSLAFVNSGLVTGVESVGNATITASYHGHYDSSSVRLSSAHITRLSIDPDSFVLGKGYSKQLEVTALYSDGNEEDVTAAAFWRSGDNSIASVFQGLVTGNNTFGSTTITAQYGGHSVDSVVTQTGETVQTLIIDPSYFELGLGASRQLRVDALYTGDVGRQDVTSSIRHWYSDSPSVARVLKGNVTATGSGGASIEALYGGRNVQSTVISNPGVSLVDLEVSPKSVNLAKGETQQLKAELVYSDTSRKDVTDLINWSSNSADVLVSAGGQVTAHGDSGTATITATYAVTGGDDLTDTVLVTLGGKAPKELDINESDFTLPNGDSQTLTTTLTWTDGTTDSNPSAVTWQSSNPVAVSVDSNSGQVTAHGDSGTATITATYAVTGGDDLTDTVLVTLGGKAPKELDINESDFTLPNGDSQTLTTTLTWTDGTTDSNPSAVTWQSSNPVAVSVDSNSGQVTAHGDSGTATITATYAVTGGDDLTDTVLVTLGGKAPKELDINESDFTLPNGDSQTLTTTLTWTDGTTDSNPSAVTWQSSNPVAVSVDSNSGQVTAHGDSGTATITATYAVTGGDDLTDTVLVTLGGKAPKELDINESDFTLPNGDSQTLTTTLTWTDGTTDSNPSAVTWQSSNPVAVSVDSNSGQVTAHGDSGTATITATYAVTGGDDLTDTVLVTLGGKAPKELDINESDFTLPNGDSQTLTTTLTWTDGTTDSNPSAVTWQSSNPVAVSVDSNSGQVTAHGDSGTATITATYAVTGGDDLTDTVLVTLGGKAPKELDINESDFTLPNGDSQTLTTTLTWTDGTTDSNPSAVTWQSSNPVAVSVDSNSGQVTAHGDSGTATITATYAVTGGDDLTDTVLVTLGGKAPKELDINESDFTLPNGDSQTLTTTLTWTDGTTDSNPSAVTWQSSNPVAVSVDSNSGQVTAHGDSGTATITATYAVTGGDDLTDTVLVTLGGKAPKELDINESDFTLPNGDSQTLTTTLTWTDGTTDSNPSAVTWQSSNPVAVSVDSNSGQVTAHGDSGTATITATYAVTGGDDLTDTVLVTLGGKAPKELDINESDFTLPNGDSQTLTTTLTWTDGTTDSNPSAVTWQSSNPVAVSVDSNSGQVTAHGDSGTATITATYAVTGGDDLTDTVLVTLGGKAPKELDINESDFTLPNGDSQTLTTTLTWTDGTTDSNPSAVTWQSSNPVAVSVDSNSGQVTAHGDSGTATITATYAVTGGDDLTDTVLVTLGGKAPKELDINESDFTLPNGDSQTLTTTLTWTDGTTDSNPSAVTWQSSNPVAVSVDSNSGQVTAHGDSGTATITATYAVTGGDDLTDTVLVTLGGKAPKELDINESDFTLPNGDSQTLTTTLTWTDGTTDSNPSAVTWQSSNPVAVSVDSNSGQVTAHGDSGTATITATYAVTGGDDLTDTVLVTLGGKAPKELDINESDFTLPNGDSQTLTTTLTWTDGTTDSNPSAVTWQSSNPVAVSVDSNSGQVTAHGDSGTATITATYAVTGGDDLTDTVLVTLGGKAPKELDINESDFTLPNGDSQTLTTTLTWTDGTTDSNPSAVTWQSSNPVAVSVDSNSGQVTAHGDSGTATITATYAVTGGDDLTDTVLVTLESEVVITDITSSLDDILLTVDATETVTLTAEYSNNTTGSFDPSLAMWNSTNEAVAVVNDDGAITGVGTGSSTISWFYESESDFFLGIISVSVYEGTIEEIIITPDPISIPLGVDSLVVAEAKLSSGDYVDVTEWVSWDVTDESIVVSGEGGRLTPISLGQTQLIARFNGHVKIVDIEVTDILITAVKLEIDPKVLTLLIDTPYTVSAKVVDADGNEHDVTIDSLDVVVSDADILQVSDLTAIGIAPGQAYVDFALKSDATVSSRLDLNVLYGDSVYLRGLPAQVYMSDLVSYGSTPSSGEFEVDGTWDAHLQEQCSESRGAYLSPEQVLSNQDLKSKFEGLHNLALTTIATVPYSRRSRVSYRDVVHQTPGGSSSLAPITTGYLYSEERPTMYLVLGGKLVRGETAFNVAGGDRVLDDYPISSKNLLKGASSYGSGVVDDYETKSIVYQGVGRYVFSPYHSTHWKDVHRWLKATDFKNLLSVFSDARRTEESTWQSELIYYCIDGMCDNPKGNIRTIGRDGRWSEEPYRLLTNCLGGQAACFDEDKYHNSENRSGARDFYLRGHYETIRPLADLLRHGEEVAQTRSTSQAAIDGGYKGGKYDTVLINGTSYHSISRKYVDTADFSDPDDDYPYLNGHTGELIRYEPGVFVADALYLGTNVICVRDN